MSLFTLMTSLLQAKLHLKNLEEVLTRLESKGLRLKREKCALCYPRSSIWVTSSLPMVSILPRIRSELLLMSPSPIMCHSYVPFWEWWIITGSFYTSYLVCSLLSTNFYRRKLGGTGDKSNRKLSRESKNYSFHLNYSCTTIQARN